MTDTSVDPRHYRDVIRKKLAEWGKIDKDTAIHRLTPLMPLGYAWRRWVIDTKKTDVYDDENYPDLTAEEVEKVQRYLAMWYIRQGRREGWIKDMKGNIIKYVAKPKPRAR